MVSNKPIQIAIASIGTTLTSYYSPGRNRNGLIKSIAINGPGGSGYSVTVYKILGNTQGGSIILYSLILDEGDFVVDSVERSLASGDSIQAFASIDGVSLSIDGEEVAVNSSSQGLPVTIG